MDASNLQKDVRKTLQSLTASADAAEQNVATLAALDLGKQRMETTCTTLKVTGPLLIYRQSLVRQPL